MVDQVITITHPQDDASCPILSPIQVSLKTGQILKFRAVNAKFRVFLHNNGIMFLPNEFEIYPTNDVLVEVLIAGKDDLIMELICSSCTSITNVEARKKIVIKNVGETVEYKFNKLEEKILYLENTINTLKKEIMHG